MADRASSGSDRKPPEDSRRAIPAVGRLLERPEFRRLFEVYGRPTVTVQVQRLLAELRGGGAEQSPVTPGKLAKRVESELETLVGVPLRRVLNATGIFLHTNLGRAPLPRAVAEASVRLLTASCDLEMDLVSGRRGDRNRRAEMLLCQLTGAGAALVVNNNAAALLLALAALSRDREAVVSRGELVEIGGSFRIPDIVEAAGVRLVEVGTTNRTRLADYQRAIGADTGLLLKVHPSNYRIRGFVESVAEEDLAAVAKNRGLPLVVDEGSGLLRPHSAPQLADHRSLSELLAVGCDLVCGSGDKLLGGPQAGLLLGSEPVIERLRRHPLYRALRASRATFIALEPVLRLHLAGEALPIDRLWPDPDRHQERVETVAAALAGEVVEAEAFLGGGAAPDAPIPGSAVALEGSERLLRRLRLGEPAVAGYLRTGKLVLDLRTVDPEDDSDLIAAVGRARVSPRRSGSGS